MNHLYDFQREYPGDKGLDLLVGCASYEMGPVSGDCFGGEVSSRGGGFLVGLPLG